MSSELSPLRISRQVVEGQGRVTYTFSSKMLHDVLKQVGVKEPDDLPEEVLREFCRYASYAEIERHLEYAEQQQPGGTAILIKDEQGMAEIRSSDVGFDAMMRLLPEPNDELDLLCNPQYSPVEFDLRVFNDQIEEANPARNIGRRVLRVTLEPPSLA